MSFKQAMKNVKKGGGYDDEEAAAIVASASRNASPAAKRANPKLAKVKGKSKAKGKGKPAPKGKPARPMPKFGGFKGQSGGFGNPFE